MRELNRLRMEHRATLSHGRQEFAAVEREIRKFIQAMEEFSARSDELVIDPLDDNWAFGLPTEEGDRLPRPRRELVRVALEPA